MKIIIWGLLTALSFSSIAADCNLFALEKTLNQKDREYLESRGINVIEFSSFSTLQVNDMVVLDYNKKKYDFGRVEASTSNQTKHTLVRRPIKWVKSCSQLSKKLKISDCERGEENGRCNDAVYADNRSQTRMMEKSDRNQEQDVSAPTAEAANI